MKQKVIALLLVAIMTLAVCSVVSITTSQKVEAAKPVSTTLSEKVYTYDFYNYNQPFEIGPRSGKITFDTVSGDYSVQLNSKLEPNTAYDVGVINVYSSSAYGFGWLPITTDDHGHFSTSGTVGDNPQKLAIINERLDIGGVFAVYEIH